MRKTTILILLLATLTSHIPTSAQGLRIQGLDSKINERSSITVFRHGIKTDEKGVSISFKSRLTQDADFGYICRIKYGKDIIALVHVGELRSEKDEYILIWEGHKIIASTERENEENCREWTDISIQIKPDTGTAGLIIGNDLSAEGSADLKKNEKVRIVFGRDGTVIDVLPFIIRDISVKVKGTEFHFPLSETKGHIAKGNKVFRWALISNPQWRNSDSKKWKQVLSVSSDSYQASGFNEDTHEIYSISNDSIITYDIRNEKTAAAVFAGKKPVHSYLGTSFIMPDKKTVCVYEVYSAGLQDSVAVALLDRNTLSWKSVGRNFLGSQLHHHNEWLDAENNRFIIYGGYGNRAYNGNFYSLDLKDFQWEEIWKERKGDELWPRFLGAMGYDKGKKTLLLYGGAGNESGKQIVGYKNYYDLHSLDTESLECKSLWELDHKGPSSVTGRNLIIDDEGKYFYALVYSASNTDTKLKLTRFSIETGEMETLHDDIPLYSDRISCMGNLHYDSKEEKLIVITETSKDDRQSVVKAYTLSFPPDLSKEGHKWGLVTGCTIGAAIVLCVVVILSRRKKRQNPEILPIQSSSPQGYSSAKDKINAIYLFGEFSAYDKGGNDISNEINGKLRQILCLVIKQNITGGLTTKRLTSMVWPEREELQAKNIRGVTISNLRKALSKIEGLELIFSDGKYSLEITRNVYIDYIDFLDTVNSPKADMDKAVSILLRGSFLSDEKDMFYDKMKEDVENLSENIVLGEIKKKYDHKQWTKTIQCADILLRLDPISETSLFYSLKALLAKERYDDAKLRYKEFISRYKRDYGEDYPHSFESCVGDSEQ